MIFVVIFFAFATIVAIALICDPVDRTKDHFRPGFPADHRNRKH